MAPLALDLVLRLDLRPSVSASRGGRRDFFINFVFFGIYLLFIMLEPYLIFFGPLSLLLLLLLRLLLLFLLSTNELTLALSPIIRITSLLSEREDDEFKAFVNYSFDPLRTLLSSFNFSMKSGFRCCGLSDCFVFAYYRYPASQALFLAVSTCRVLFSTV